MFYIGYSATSDKNAFNSTSDTATKNSWWKDLGLPVVIGTILAVIGIFIAIFKDWIKDHISPPPRPELSINPNENPAPVRITVPLVLGTRFPQQIENITATYVVNRIIVRNNGNAIALGCEGIIRINDEDLRVCWDEPNHTQQIDIPIGGRKYLDLCACLDDDPQAKIEEMRVWLDEFDAWDAEGRLISGEEANVIKEEIMERIQAPDGIPQYIAPTENGWPHPAGSNRILHPTDATIVIHSRDVEPIERVIRILDRPQGGIMIAFN